MSVLKTYSIQNDIADQTVKLGRLNNEIASSVYITDFSHIDVSGDVLKVFGETLDDENSLDILVQEHESVNLDDYKNIKNSEIDIRTGELIDQGAEFEEEVFSLSSNAQTYWMGFKINCDEGAIPFPYKVSRKNSTRHTITDTDHGYALWFAVSGKVAEHLASGGTLRDQVNIATNKSEVDSVIDNR